MSENLEPHVMDRYDIGVILSNRRQKVRVVTEVRFLLLRIVVKCMQVDGAHRKKHGIRKFKISVRGTKLQIKALM